jgi:hypothetical protein
MAVGRQRIGDALSGLSNGTSADQLDALLAPDATAPSVNPRSTGGRVILSPTDDGGIAVGRQRDRGAL